MTSANVIEYRILNKEGEVIGYHRHNVMCSRCNDGLAKYTPASDYRIETFGYDEEEDYWENDQSEKLSEWLLKNKGEFTHKRFEVNDSLEIHRKGRGVVLEVIKGTFQNSYSIKLETGEILEYVLQNKIKPEL